MILHCQHAAGEKANVSLFSRNAIRKSCSSVGERDAPWESRVSLKVALPRVRSKVKYSQIPIPSRLLLYHDFAAYQDMLLVVHDLRKGILDIRRVNDMNRKMPRLDTERLMSAV